MCAAEGVHYVDLTGEPAFMGEMARLHSAAAQSTKALLVPACGFDSVPSDLCAYLAAKTLKEASVDGDEPVEVGKTVCFVEGAGGVSGGTFATLSKSSAAVADSDVAGPIVDPVPPWRGS